MVRCLITFTSIWYLMVQETRVQSQVKSYQRLKKWYLIPPCLTISIIKYISRVKWNNPGKVIAPTLTPWCSSYVKRGFQVALNYSCQLYEVHTISFQTFFIWALLLIVHTWNSSPLWSNLQLQCTCCTVPMEVLLCERVNDLHHSLFHLLNCLITTASELRE